MAPTRLEIAGPGGSRWWQLAACRGAHIDDFYGPGAQHGVGLAWCRHCPVTRPCLWQAVAEEHEAGYAFGIRGGMSAPQRTALAADLGPEVITLHLAEALAGADPTSSREVA